MILITVCTVCPISQDRKQQDLKAVNKQITDLQADISKEQEVLAAKEGSKNEQVRGSYH